LQSTLSLVSTLIILLKKYNSLPSNWILYIPDYKTYKSDVEGVDVSLTNEEILQGITQMDR